MEREVLKSESLNPDLLEAIGAMRSRNSEVLETAEASKDLKGLMELLCVTSNEDQCHCTKCVAISLMATVAGVAIKELVVGSTWTDDQLQLFAKVFYNLVVCNTAVVETMADLSNQTALKRVLKLLMPIPSAEDTFTDPDPTSDNPSD